MPSILAAAPARPLSATRYARALPVPGLDDGRAARPEPLADRFGEHLQPGERRVGVRRGVDLYGGDPARQPAGTEAA